MTTIIRSTRLHFTAAANRLHITVPVLVLAAGCALPGEADEQLSQTESAISVATAVGASCSTSKVIGLARQIADEVDCMSGANTLVRFKPTSRIKFTSSAVLPYLNASAKNDLTAAGNAATLQINSGYRTLPQQYLLYKWFRAHRCGIKAAAPPGTSNHESARAVDLANWSTRVSVMSHHHWAHDVPGDVVHFDHLSSPNITGRDVKAFQRLWNRNHPGDKIATDGDYGPATAARLRKSPAGGFKVGSNCHAARPVEDAVVSIEGPDLVAPGQRAHYTIQLQNVSGIDWPADTELVVAGGTESELYDAQTWVSKTDVGPLGAAIVANGGEGTLELDVAAPAMTEETSLYTAFSLQAGGVEIGQLDLSLTVTPNGDDGLSGDQGDDPEDMIGTEDADEDGVMPDATGGCSAGGSGASWLALALPLVLLRRRRR
jgi:Synergist-CTERM protein sorting domain-containing protein